MRFFAVLALAALAVAAPSEAETTRDMNTQPVEQANNDQATTTISTLLRMMSGGRFEVENMNEVQKGALQEVERIIETLGENIEVEETAEDAEGRRLERRQWWYYPHPRPHHHGHHHHHHHGHHHGHHGHHRGPYY